MNVIHRTYRPRWLLFWMIFYTGNCPSYFSSSSLLVVEAAKIPKDFSLDDAIEQSTQQRKKLHEKQRREKNQKSYRESRGLPLAESAEDVWKRNLMEEGEAAPNRGFKRTVESSQWVVSATTPNRTKMENEPPRGTLLASKQVPYVHWLCYRGDETNDAPANEQLVCCQEIFRAMLQDPAGLCWKACWKADEDACGSGPNATDVANLDMNRQLAEEANKENNKNKQHTRAASSKAAFMSHCTHQLARVPSLPAYAKNALPPRWSLVIAPETMNQKPTLLWRQFVLVQGTNTGVWIRNVPSPIRLARPLSLAPSNSTDNDDPEAGTFGASIVSRIGASEDDEELRVFTHTVALNLSNLETTTADDDAFVVLDANLTVLLALPSELRLPHPKKGKTISETALSACRSTCKGSCRISVETAPAPTVKKRTAWGEQSVVALRVRLEQLEKKTKSCELQWSTTLWLEDEEQLLVAPPLLYHGTLITYTQSGDGIDGSSQQTFVWDGKLNPLAPLLTDLEEKERLEDLWKTEL
jgi:hypothetical protein